MYRYESGQFHMPGKESVMIRLLGVLLILFGCGAFGFSAAASYRNLEKDLRSFIRAIEYMECELQFRKTPLPELCQQAGHIVNGRPSTFLSELAHCLLTQQHQDAPSCVTELLNRQSSMDARMLEYISEFGSTLGTFDLTGQINGLQAVRSKCQMYLKDLNSNKENRLRSYQTLGLCAGAALAIILI